MIELVKWKKEYSESFYLQSNSAELYRNMSDSFPKTLKECKNIVEWFANSNDETECARAIVIDGKVVGCIAVFFEKDLYEKNAEIAYWIGKEYWGQGIMTETVKQFTQYIFRHYVLSGFTEGPLHTIRARRGYWKSQALRWKEY